jgi:hypothetical protein
MKRNGSFQYFTLKRLLYIALKIAIRIKEGDSKNSSELPQN